MELIIINQDVDMSKCRCHRRNSRLRAIASLTSILASKADQLKEPTYRRPHPALASRSRGCEPKLAPSGPNMTCRRI
jgi:hypothetical protein